MNTTQTTQSCPRSLTVGAALLCAALASWGCVNHPIEVEDGPGGARDASAASDLAGSTRDLSSGSRDMASAQDLAGRDLSGVDLASRDMAGPPADLSVPPGDMADPFGGPSVCTSGRSWTGGNKGSSQMHPGKGCIGCHASSAAAPKFSVAGTVYPTGHEPDDCYSTASGAIVEVTDAAGKVLTLTTNSVGNFYSTTSLSLPYRAKVKYMGRERAMGSSQSSGDCNSCHTQTGAGGAPGRVLLP